MEDLKDIPAVTDWKVIEAPQAIYIESETISNMGDYDDAWLKVAGNMTVEAAKRYAQFIAAKLNRA